MSYTATVFNVMIASPGDVQIERDLARVWPTSRGFDFLSDLQALFLPQSTDA